MASPRYPTDAETAELASQFAAEMASREAEKLAAARAKIKEPDPVYQPLTPDQVTRAEQFMDLGWDGTGWKPSELMTIGVALFATLDGSMAPALIGQVSKKQARYEADQLQASIVAQARDLWRRGFYANPFARTPRLRDAV